MTPHVRLGVAGLSEVSYSTVSGLARSQYLSFKSQPQAQGSSPWDTSLTTSASILPSTEDELLELSTGISNIHCGSLWGRGLVPNTASRVFHWTIAFHLSSQLWNLEKHSHEAAAPFLPLTTAVPAATRYSLQRGQPLPQEARLSWQMADVLPAAYLKKVPSQLLLATLWQNSNFHSGEDYIIWDKRVLFTKGSRSGLMATIQVR